MDPRSLLAGACALFVAGLTASLFALGRDRPVRPRLGAALLWAGFAVQSVALYWRGVERTELPVANVFEMLQVLAWGVVAVDILLRMATRLRLPDVLVCGLAALFSAIAFLRVSWDGAPSAAFEGNPWIGFHVGAIVLAFSFFAALAVNSIAYLLQYLSLSGRHPGAMSRVLPPLRQLDRVGTQLLGVGLALFTLALAVGFAGLFHRGAESSVFKLLVAACVWAGYATVYTMRRMERLGGRGFARAGLILFLLAMFSLWPANNRRKALAKPAAGHVISGGTR